MLNRFEKRGASIALPEFSWLRVNKWGTLDRCRRTSRSNVDEKNVHTGNGQTEGPTDWDISRISRPARDKGITYACSSLSCEAWNKPKDVSEQVSNPSVRPFAFYAPIGAGGNNNNNKTDLKDLGFSLQRLDFLFDLLGSISVSSNLTLVFCDLIREEKPSFGPYVGKSIGL